MELENGRLCDDILIEILARLPKKSLARFNCVSRRWGHLISDLRRQRNDSGLLWQYTDHHDGSLHVTFHRVLEDGITVPDHALDFSFKEKDPSLLVDSSNGSSFRVVDSCNGLLLIQQACFRYPSPSFLISASSPPSERRSSFVVYHVYNPATKNSVALPPIPCRFGIIRVGLAFDGCHHYKVIYFFDKKQLDILDFIVFSSDIGEWKETQVPFSRPTSFSHVIDKMPLAIFWKGAMYWIVSNNGILMYHLEGNYCKLLQLPDFGGYHDAWLLELEEGLQCCRVNIEGIYSWVLHMDGWYCNDHDCGEFEWQLKHFASWKSINSENPGVIPPHKPNKFLHVPRHLDFFPVAVNGEFCILYLSDGEISISYNFADGKLKVCTYPVEVSKFRKKWNVYPFLYNKISFP